MRIVFLDLRLLVFIYKFMFKLKIVLEIELGDSEGRVDLKVSVFIGKIWKFLIFWWWYSVSTNVFGLFWLLRRRNSLGSGKLVIYNWFFLKFKMNCLYMSIYVCMCILVGSDWEKWVCSYDILVFWYMSVSIWVIFSGYRGCGI